MIKKLIVFFLVISFALTGALADECQHDTTETRSIIADRRYESTGDLKYHQYKYDIYTIVECSNCGQEVSREKTNTESVNSTHGWNDEGFCYRCGQVNSCLHKNEGQRTKSISDESVKIDDKTHLDKFVTTIYAYCLDCGVELGELQRKQYEIVAKHRWHNDICSECNAENQCDHANIFEKEGYNDIVYTDAGDGVHHKVEVNTQIYKYCAVCNIKIDDGEEKIQEYYEKHTAEEGCEMCDYETGNCLHDGEKRESIKWRDRRYEEFDDKQHAEYGKKTTTIFCSKCDKELSTTISEEEELRRKLEHDWKEDGICYDCDYKNTCMHENASTELRFSYESGYIAQNKEVHSQTVIFKEFLYCLDCGAEIPQIERLIKTEQIEEHQMSKGFCKTCGYKNICRHFGTTHVEKNYQEYFSSESIDEKTHRLCTILLTQTICDLCKDVIAEQKEEMGWYTEEHVIEGSKCKYCDYELGCEHNNISLRTLPDTDYRLMCKSIADNAHASTYNLYYSRYCEDCDSILELNAEGYAGITTVNEPHDMKNGYCVNCGYCLHQKEYSTEQEYLGSRYEQYDEFRHKLIYNYRNTAICNLCGDVVKTWEEENLHMLKHDYNSQSVCYDCGYQNACPHENAYWTLASGTTIYHDNINDPDQHQSRMIKYSHMFCPDCLHTWDFKQNEPIVSMEKHVYRIIDGMISNECDLCGYAANAELKPCLHENTENYSEWDEEYTEYLDEEYHVYYMVNEYEVTYCEDCYSELSRILIREGKNSSKGRHYFDKNTNKCHSCGCTNYCKHENTIIDYEGKVSYALQIDDTHHQDIIVYQKIIRCVNCAVILEYCNEFETRIAYYEHHFEDGVCYSCKYKKSIQCKHKDTQVSHSYEVGYKKIDDTYHETIIMGYDYEECLSCGEGWFLDNDKEEVRALMPHAGKTVCSQCGWSNAEHTCTLKDHERRIFFSAKAIDGLTHEAVIQRETFRRCEECGDESNIIAQQSVETVVEPHSFTDSGRCKECGYVNFCTHEQTYEDRHLWGEHNYKAKDDHEHVFSAVVLTEKRCKTCDQCLGRTEKLSDNCTEEHIFDSIADVLCNLCGYEREAPEEVPTPEPTPTSTPVVDDGGNGDSGSGSSGGNNNPSRPKDPVTPTPEEAVPRTGDNSLPLGFLILLVTMSLCGISLMTKKKRG